MEKKYSECFKCKASINYDEAYISITRNIEQANINIFHNRDEIEIIDSEELISLCRGCGSQFNANNIVQIIMSVPTSDDNIRSN